VLFAQSVIPVTEKIKCFGVYINSKTNSKDPSMALRKFFGSFNNIMISVLGYARDEMLAVYLVKTYCLPVLICGCETWSLSSSVETSDKYRLNMAWKNCFRTICNSCWRKNVNPVLFYCNNIPAINCWPKTNDFS